MRAERSQRNLIAAVVAGGAAAVVAVWLSSPPALGVHVLVRAAVLVAVTAFAELVSIRLPHGGTSERITLGEVAVVADIALLPAAIAPLVVVAGGAIVLGLRRRVRVKIAYNAGRYALATVAAVAIFDGLGGGTIANVMGLAALFGGMAAFAVSNLLTICAIIAGSSGRPFPSVVREELRLWLAVAIGNSSVGMVAVAMWSSRPVLVPAILGPALALHLAHRGWVRQIESAAEIADEKEKLERIVSHSSEGIALADASGTVVLWSPSMERITGVSATEAEGKSLGYLLRGRTSDGSSVHIEVGGRDAEMQVTRADGAERWLRVRHGPALDEDGTPKWDVVVVHDVTTEHDTEKLKDHFLATVSHELRTPLTPIIGFAKFLLRREDVDPQVRRDALASVLERSEHMQRLVEDLLLASNVGKDGSVRVHSRREPVDVAEVVARGVASARVTHPKRDIVLERGGPVLAVGDSVRITQILANLIDNAIKFSPDETRVIVRVEREGDEAVFMVSDRGRGIPTDRQRDIFDKFRRLENPDKMETGGAGLGLFIVDQLVRAMGGRVSVLSLPGRGATFTVRLAALAVQASEEPKTQLGTSGPHAVERSA